MDSNPDDDTGGNENGDTDNSFFDGAFSTLWGWLSSIADGITSVKEDIVSGIVNFKDDVHEFLNGIYSFVVNIWSHVIDLPETIGGKIKDIFIPDTAEIENIIDSMVENISSQLGVQFDTLDRLFEREVAPVDVEESYNVPGVGTMKLKFFDTEYLIKGVALMRPYIRGFIVLLLLFFIWRQVMSFIGQDPSIAHHAQQEYEKWRGKEE